jgi:hypothetical protein
MLIRILIKVGKDIMALVGCFGLIIIIWAFSVSPSFGVILLVTLFGLAFYFDRKGKQEREESEYQHRINREKGISNLRNKENFKFNKKFEGNPHVSQMISIDEKNKKIAFIDGEKYRVKNYRDILSSELLIDGDEVIKTSRTSQIGGALIGGALAGGVGAIIGGLSGEQTKESKVSRVDLLVTVNDTRNPSFVLNFFNKDNQETKIPHPKHLVKDEIGQAEELHRLISVLIHQADEADRVEEQKSKQELTKAVVSSMADEIRKLADLKEEGLINDEEYEKQKIKLFL